MYDDYVNRGVIDADEATGGNTNYVKLGLVYDSRDNVFDPNRGMIAGMTIKAASRSIASETDFIKGLAQVGAFLPVRGNLIFAASLKGGVARAQGDSVDLPLVERFLPLQHTVKSSSVSNQLMVSMFQKTSLTKCQNLIC